jgi:hypothetical protein
MIDENGKLFGKVNIIDAGAFLLIVLGLLGFFVVRSNRSEAQSNQVATKTIQFDLFAQGNFKNPKVFKVGDQVAINIRNQPAGMATIEKVQVDARTVTFLPADGKLKSFPDPDAPYGKKITFTLKADASQTPNGYVIGGAKIKIGIPVEIETALYSLKGSTIDVRAE